MRKNKVLIICLIIVNVCLLSFLGIAALKIHTDNILNSNMSLVVEKTTEPQQTTDTAVADVSPTSESGESQKADIEKSGTIKELLQNAMKPVGQTLYVYGGGWNEADTGAGVAAVTIGVSPQWRDFYNTQNANYDSSQYRYQIEKGLDCSGYIGWVIYNTIENTNGNEGYVFMAEECADKYSQMGFGEKTPLGMFTDYIPGDILSSKSDHHVWISLGQCSDGSVVFVNATPPGVRICGTATRDGNTSSEAVKLAEKFMSEQFADWYSKFPSCEKGAGYLVNYDRMRWDLSGNSVLTDPEGYAELTPEEVLTDLFMG